MSKLGLHVISWNQSQPILDFMGKAHAVVLKMLEFNDVDTDATQARSPGTIFIGRLFVNSQPLDIYLSLRAQRAMEYIAAISTLIHR